MTGKKLYGRVALMTGASKGLGKAMALALAGGGAKLALVSRNQDQLEARQPKMRSVRAEALRCSVADVTVKTR